MTQPDPVRGPRPARSPAAEQLRESVRVQMLASIGGWSGALIAAVPTVVFVAVNVTSSLRPAIYAAVGSALLLTAYRLVRKQSVQQALSGLFGVVIAAVIAARTGQARGYFLVGILTSFAYAVPFLVSVLVRRPLIGVLWEFLEPTPPDDAAPWHRRRILFVAYTWASLIAFAVFALRGGVQLILYKHNADGWLGFAKIAMGYPLFIAAAGAVFVIVRRARVRVVAADVPAAVVPDTSPAADPSVLGRQDGAA